MATISKYLLAYYNDKNEEQIEELYAYSAEQADFLAEEICDRSRWIGDIECTVRSAAY